MIAAKNVSLESRFKLPALILEIASLLSAALTVTVLSASWSLVYFALISIPAFLLSAPLTTMFVSLSALAESFVLLSARTVPSVVKLPPALTFVLVFSGAFEFLALTVVFLRVTFFVAAMLFV